MALFTGAFFVAQVSLIIVAKPFYAIFCTSCVPHHENPRIIVGKVVENFYAILRDFTELYKILEWQHLSHAKAELKKNCRLNTAEAVDNVNYDLPLKKLDV